MDNQQKRNLMAEEIWLQYFNTYLFEHNLITEDERNKMCVQIKLHCDRKRKGTDR